MSERESERIGCEGEGEIDQSEEDEEGRERWEGKSQGLGLRDHEKSIEEEDSVTFEDTLAVSSIRFRLVRSRSRQESEMVTSCFFRAKRGTHEIIIYRRENFKKKIIRVLLPQLLIHSGRDQA